MDSKISLQSKKIVVVGGAGLLGAKITEAIVKAGGQCVIADISLEKAKQVADEIEVRIGTKPEVIAVSINDPNSVDKMIIDLHRIGKIDALINAAYPRNSNYGKKFEAVQYSDFCENVNLHLGGYFLVSQKILEYFKVNGGGVLLNSSSIYGVIAPRFDIYEGTQMTMPVEYAAIKSAIIHLTKYMAKYYKGNQIRVNCISLGGLEAGQPAEFLEGYSSYCLDKGMLSADDILGTVLFLLSNESRFINGQNIVVDDGFTL